MLKAVQRMHARPYRRAAVIAIAAVALTQQAIAGLAASGSWTIVPSPSPPASLATLSSVSCPDATSCFAVGDAFARGTDRPLAERWDGSAWSVMQTAGLSVVGGLDSVSCPTAQWCMTVGTRTPAGGGLAQTLAAVWDGTSWSRISSPTPGQGATLTGVACATTSSCFAVGGYTSTSGGQFTLIEHWDGASWRISQSPRPSGLASVLQGVSCPTVSGCFAVGEYEPSQRTDRTLTERWNGSSWSIVASPNVKSSQLDKLYGVACTTTTACEAIGLYQPAGQGSLTLAERWNGTSWSVVPSADPTTGGDSLFDVSCSTPTRCVAVGTYALTTGVDATLIELWDGAGWTLVKHPNPRPSNGAVMLGIDCTITTTCVAVGYNFPTTTTQRTLVEQRTAA